MGRPCVGPAANAMMSEKLVDIRPPVIKCRRRKHNVIYFGSGRGASRPVEVLKTLAIYRRAGALPLKSSRFVPK